MRIPKNIAEMVINLIDVVSLRGAIKGEELSNVGELRKYMIEYVNYQNLSEQSEEKKEE